MLLYADSFTYFLVTDDRSSLEAAIPNNPLDVPQAVLALRERLELLENRTSETAPLVAGLADRLGAVETALRELREANDSENKAFGNGGPFESGRSASETDGKGSTARAQRGAEPASSLEERLELLEQILILETGASDLRGVLNPNPLSPKSAKPLSPRSPNPVLSPKPLNAKSPRGQQPAAADAKPRLASVERRLGGLEARLDALASNEATGAAALAETRARVQGLDKRVQGLHRNVDLEAQLSKRVAAAEWRLEQVGVGRSVAQALEIKTMGLGRLHSTIVRQLGFMIAQMIPVPIWIGGVQEWMGSRQFLIKATGLEAKSNVKSTTTRLKC